MLLALLFLFAPGAHGQIDEALFEFTRNWNQGLTTELWEVDDLLGLLGGDWFPPPARKIAISGRISWCPSSTNQGITDDRDFDVMHHFSTSEISASLYLFKMRGYIPYLMPDYVVQGLLMGGCPFPEGDDADYRPYINEGDYMSSQPYFLETDGYDCVWNTGTGWSSIGPPLKDVVVPVIQGEPSNLGTNPAKVGSMHMFDTTSGGTISDPVINLTPAGQTHELTSGFPASFTVFSATPRGIWVSASSAAPGVTVLATWDSDPTKSALAVMEAGGAYADGRHAPARRVQAFWDGGEVRPKNGDGIPPLWEDTFAGGLSPQGKLLHLRMFEWAMADSLSKSPGPISPKLSRLKKVAISGRISWCQSSPNQSPTDDRDFDVMNHFSVSEMSASLYLYQKRGYIPYLMPDYVVQGLLMGGCPFPKGDDADYRPYINEGTYMTSQTDFLEADGYDCIWNTGTCWSSIGPPLKNVAIPVIQGEPFNLGTNPGKVGSMHMFDTSSGGEISDTVINLTPAGRTHELTSGFPASFTVFSATPSGIGVDASAAAPGVTVLATWNSDPTKSALAVMETGGLYADGTMAPARRVQAFWDGGDSRPKNGSEIPPEWDDIFTDALSPRGKLLHLRMFEWAMNDLSSKTP